MDNATLKQKVIDAVNAKINAREAFTTVDISHPLISEDNSVRHKQVRPIIEELWAKGEFEDAAFTASPITVYPKPNDPQTVRLFHPDEPGFDPNSYTATNQVLVRDGQPAATPASSDGAITRGFSMDADGDDGSDDGAQVVTSTPSGAKVTCQCQIQPANDVVNVPRIIVKRAGWSPGDNLSIASSGKTLTIQRETNGSQQVDKEGRIRLHGGNVSALQRSRGEPVTALLVSPSSGDQYIQVQ